LLVSDCQLQVVSCWLSSGRSLLFASCYLIAVICYQFLFLPQLPKNLPHHPQQNFRVRRLHRKPPQHPPQLLLRLSLPARRNVPALSQRLQQCLPNPLHRLHLRKRFLPQVLRRIASTQANAPARFLLSFTSFPSFTSSTS